MHTPTRMCIDIYMFSWLKLPLGVSESHSLVSSTVFGARLRLPSHPPWLHIVRYWSCVNGIVLFVSATVC